MSSRKRVLEQLVIKPTLAYLGIQSPTACHQLANSCTDNSTIGACRNHLLGLYGIDPAQHRALWDQHLAFNPELASKVRSLASRVNFLRDPDQELCDNPAYATAIAWLINQYLPDQTATGCSSQNNSTKPISRHDGVAWQLPVAAAQ